MDICEERLFNLAAIMRRLCECETDRLYYYLATTVIQNANETDELKDKSEI